MARSSRRGKLLLLGAAVVAAGVFLKRDKVAGLLPGRGQTYEPPAPPPPPGPSNYDAPGPVANTATPVPAPEPQQPGAIDEAAEEAAAAAEAANIGGSVSDYAGPSDLPADESERPVAEAGGGEAEGQEQAELDLREAASPTAPGMSDSERQIDEAIEEAGNPLAGEQLEGVRPAEDPRGDEEAVPPAEAPPAEPPADEGSADEPSGDEPSTDDEPTAAASGWSPPVPERSDEPAPFDAGSEEAGDEPTQFEPPAAPGDEEKPKDEEGGSDWRTWSGRSVNP